MSNTPGGRPTAPGPELVFDEPHGFTISGDIRARKNEREACVSLRLRRR